MKLSKKGKSRIHEMIDCAFEAHPDDAKGVQILAKKYLTECDDFEFELDDFQDAVILTVEEAKALNNLILKLFYNEENRMSVFDATELLTKRIGQAENK